MITPGRHADKSLRRDLYFFHIFDMIRYTNRKESPMLATAIALQQATQEAVHDEEVMGMASALYHNRSEMTGDEFARAMFIYSAHLASLTATLVTHVTLTESQLDEMMNSIKEFDSLGKEIINGNE
jgi:hypothetical protein